MQYVTALVSKNWSKHMQKGGQKQKKRYYMRKAKMRRLKRLCSKSPNAATNAQKFHKLEIQTR